MKEAEARWIILKDKTLIAVHYARIAEYELFDREKQKIFSYTYKVKIPGTFNSTGGGMEFTTAIRKLPTVFYHARQLNSNEVRNLLNYGKSNGITIGNLCIGEEFSPVSF